MTNQDYDLTPDVGTADACGWVLYMDKYSERGDRTWTRTAQTRKESRPSPTSKHRSTEVMLYL